MLSLLSSALFLANLPGLQSGQFLPIGKSLITVDVGVPLEVFTYKPVRFDGLKMFVVLHGTLRDADAYRDNAIPLAERFNALIIAPKFDDVRFPNARYHRGGVVKADGTAASKEEWTYAMIPKLVAGIRAKVGYPEMPFWTMGHSAGGQFLVRMAGFYGSGGAIRMIAGNPGSQLFPRKDWDFGYGFGKLPEALATNEMMKSYLEQPLTFLLGTLDNKKDEYFDDSVEAMRQGGGRLQRGLSVFEYGRDLAQKRGWKFNWEIVTVNGVDHDNAKMFNSKEMGIALGLEK